MSIFSPACGPIGVEVSEVCAHAAQVRQRGDRPLLCAGLSWPLRTPGAFTPEDAQGLAEAMERAGFEGRDVAAFPPGKSVLTTMMELPPRSSAAPIAQIARIELARIHRLEAHAFEMGMWDLPTPDRKPGATHAMVVGLASDAGDALVSAFAAGGLRLTCLDAPMCAFARLCDASIAHVPSLVGMIDVGWSGCRVMLMHVGSGDGTLPVYERVVHEVSLAALSKSVQDKLGLSREGVSLALTTSAEDVGADDASRDLLRHARAFQGDFLDRLVSEAQRSFSYAVQMYPTLPMTTVLVTGEGHAIRGLKERLANGLGLDVRAVLPGDACAAVDGSTLAADGRLSAAVGLAMIDPRSVHQHARRTA